MPSRNSIFSEVRFKYFIVETTISILFLFLLWILKMLHRISDNAFLAGLVLWGLLTPSPYSWYLHIGNLIKAGRRAYMNSAAEENEAMEKAETENAMNGKNSAEGNER